MGYEAASTDLEISELQDRYWSCGLALVIMFSIFTCAHCFGCFMSTAVSGDEEAMIFGLGSGAIGRLAFIITGPLVGVAMYQEL